MTQTKTQKEKYILLSHKEWAEKIKIEKKRHEERGGCKYESMWWNVSCDYEEQAFSSWGDWHFCKSNLCLDLLPKNHSTKWSHNCPFYQIDLEEINNTAKILDCIYQLKGKNLSLYGEHVVRDLIDAFDDVLQPQANCCSWGGEKKFSGSKLAKKYRDKLNRQEKILNDPNRKIDLQKELSKNTTTN